VELARAAASVLWKFPVAIVRVGAFGRRPDCSPAVECAGPSIVQGSASVGGSPSRRIRRSFVASTAISGGLRTGLGGIDDRLHQSFCCRTQACHPASVIACPPLWRVRLGQAFGQPSCRACVSRNFEVVPRATRLGLRPDPNQCHKETVPRHASIDEPIEGTESLGAGPQATSARLHDQIGDSRERKSFGVCFRWSVHQEQVHLPCPSRGFRSSPAQPDTYGWLQAEALRGRGPTRVL